MMTKPSKAHASGVNPVPGTVVCPIAGAVTRNADVTAPEAHLNIVSVPSEARLSHAEPAKQESEDDRRQHHSRQHKATFDFPSKLCSLVGMASHVAVIPYLEETAGRPEGLAQGGPNRKCWSQSRLTIDTKMRVARHSRLG